MRARHVTALLALAACDDASAPPLASTVGAGPGAPAAVAAPSVSASESAPGGGAPVQAAQSSAVRPEGPLNVLFISVDSLRADMPWTGYERPIAPNLTKLASESVVYTNAYSVSSYTAKSVAAMLSGRYPSTLYRTGWFFTGYAKTNLFFTEILQESGIRTMAAHAHMYFKRGKNLEQGFDVWETVPGITFDPQTDQHVTSDKMTALAKSMLEMPENSAKPFFMWLHYMDPHDVYTKHAESPDFGKTNRDRYDSEVWYTDQQIGELLAWCEKQPFWKSTAVIVSSDHGEAFGEHGMWKHAFELWDVLVRIPLLVKAPGAKPARIDVRRSLIDLAPTVLDLARQKVPAEFDGKTLVPEVYALEKPGVREPIVLDLPADSHNPPRRAVIRGDYKIIVHGSGWKHSLYDLSKDPAEKMDLAKSNPEKLAEMKKLFDDAWAKIPSVKPYGGMDLKEGGKADGPMGPPASK